MKQENEQLKMPSKETLFFIYGSLREGQYNHGMIKDYAELISKTAVIKGFALYSLGSYPCVIKSQETDIVVGEIFKIPNDEIIKRIHQMEIYAGYKFIKTVGHDLDSKKNFNVFVYEYRNANLDSINKIDSGDWSKEMKKIKVF